MKIKNVYPEIEGGIYPVKVETDRDFVIYCEISGSAKKPLVVKFKKVSDKIWGKVQMDKEGEKYAAKIKFDKPGIYQYAIESDKLKYEKILEVIVEPPVARFAAWYEMFHRSQGKISNQSATFADCEARLPEIKEMGFNVIYFPPIHPIGRTKRKGPNNSLFAGPNDPGSPWAIGNESGGHKAVNPELGTLDDFKHFVKTAKEMGFDTAIDFALNCSPEHPYVKNHPEWFFHRPDGSIACAENPPKKYEDVYPLNFFPPNKNELWNELTSIIMFWCEAGVTHFRVDNPHTKPTELWRQMIREVKLKYPETIFLAEAFTNYEKLEELAKVGFSQSYTYFTWRNKKDELIEYTSKLTGTYLKEFLRANFFTNTPDICPPIIQTGGRPAFKMRIAIASTLSSVYGMYNGYELCEGRAFPGTEIYINSEKYQYKVWDWDRNGNIKGYIAKLNGIIKENPALHYYDNLEILNSINENVLFYGKRFEDNIILIAANLDPKTVQNARLSVPVEEYGISSDQKYIVEELITGKFYVWQGRENYVRLDPNREPVYIFRVVARPWRAAKNEIAQNQLAEQHAKRFFELRQRAMAYNDVYARRDLTDLYTKEILLLVYTGETFDENYYNAINAEAEKFGFDTIIKAYFTTPGH